MKNKKLHVLLIDDDNNYLLLMKSALATNNKVYDLNITTANHIGEIAWDILKTVNLAVIDLFMPDADGITTSLILRSEINVPVVILTANPEDDRLEVFEGMLEPIMPIEKSDNFKGTSNSIYNYFKTARDFIGLKEKINNQDILSFATGFLMNQEKCDDKTAMKKLKQIARSQGLKMDIAASNLLKIKKA